MIGYLCGNVVHAQDEELILDVGGVGYQLTVSTSVLQQSRPEEALRLYVFTDLRENSLALFGFSTILEKEVFLLLRKVKGIGSRIALSIISVLSAEGVLSAIASDDVSALKRVSGVGGKTAERILVELREAVEQLLPSGEEDIQKRVEIVRPRSNAKKSSSVSVADDAVLALEKLGFPSARAQEAVKQTLAEFGEAHPVLHEDAGELLRRALTSL